MGAKVAVYARVSKSDDSQDHANQLRQLNEYVTRQGWTPYREYVDHASGKSGDRTEFRRLMSDASKSQFDIVLVWALDRFTREGVAETFDYIKRLVGYRVQFVSYTEEHFRTTGPAGELMIAVAAWIAKQERVRISERTKAGLARVRSQGTVLGRPFKIYDRQRVLDMHAKKYSCREIASICGISAATVQRLLSKSKKEKAESK